MAKEWAKSFYNSKKWQRCRDSYIANRILVDGGVCEECRRQQGYIVHHTVTLTPDNVNDADIALNHEKMKYVCKDCHDQYEGHGVGHSKVKPLCMHDGEILFSNPSDGYHMNINKEMTMNTEEHVKDRKTDYCGYAIMDGNIVTDKAHALLVEKGTETGGGSQTTDPSGGQTGDNGDGT